MNGITFCMKVFYVDVDVPHPCAPACHIVTGPAICRVWHSHLLVMSLQYAGYGPAICRLCHCRLQVMAPGQAENGFSRPLGSLYGSVFPAVRHAVTVFFKGEEMLTFYKYLSLTYRGWR